MKRLYREYVTNSGGQEQLVPLLREILAEQIPFSMKTFTKATWLTALKHLQKEIQEVIDCDKVNLGEDEANASLMEYADCFILLLDSFWRRHPDFYDGNKLLIAVWNKIQINKRRTWQAPNAEGFVEHVRDPLVNFKTPTDADLDRCCNICTTPIGCLNAKYCAFEEPTAQAWPEDKNKITRP
jgi:hypothetical protein